MLTITKLWAAWRQLLKNEYRDERGTVHCGEVAESIAKALSAEGKIDIRFLHVRGLPRDRQGNTEILVPVAYGGRITWGGHIVCWADGKVYDPILPWPVPLEDYRVLAFDAPFQVIRQDKWEG